MASIRHFYILVGIETDPTRFHGEHASPPALLDRLATEQVLAHIAADLNKILPSINQCTLTMAGGLYDQTQILRPRLPVYLALEALQQSGNPGDDFQPRLLSVGTSDGQMPLKELQPYEDIPLGLLQILPILLSGPEQQVSEFASQMEHLFLDQGQLSAHSAKGIESQFQISVNHARFMTITDLNAMFRLQLEHFGFLPLWELIDAAMSQNSANLDIETTGGLKFKWNAGEVHSVFESFDWWAQFGSGSDLPASERKLHSEYADWTREYRRYLTMLDAHGITVIQHLPGLEDAGISDSFLLEESTVVPTSYALAVTEHTTDDLGTIAVTVVNGRRQINFYPLLPEGLNDLQKFIREQDLSGDTAFPGHINYDENTRQLISESKPA